ncbi:neuropeptide Y receptor type 4-2-like [Littorina saxatilis]|uniref:neuropeptide Y receptor type 4-2-like n=1 Tax=Littorina saxatilis TaxID=31220 RepID=UPI0038B62833
MHKLMSKPSTLKNRLKRRSRELNKRMSKRFSWGNYHQETRGIMSFSRTFVVCCVLFLSFLSSYIPIVVLQSLEVFLPEYYNRMTGELFPLKHVSYLLFFTSDFVHPIMWGFINNSFRREVRHLFSDCGWKRRLILESQSDLQSSTVPAPPSPRPSIVWRRKGK